MKYLKFKEDILKKFTKNYAFREVTWADFFPYYKANTNELFNKFLLTETSQNEAEVKEIIGNKIKENKELNKEVNISIIEKQTGKWVGFLTCYDYEDKIAASLMIAPEYWGTGAAQEIAKASTQIFLKHSGFDEIYVRIFKGNKKTVQLNYALGAQLRGESSLLNSKKELCEYFILSFKEVKREIIIEDITQSE